MRRLALVGLATVLTVGIIGAALPRSATHDAIGCLIVAEELTAESDEDPQR